jgi:hypothetical protein
MDAVTGLLFGKEKKNNDVRQKEDPELVHRRKMALILAKTSVGDVKKIMTQTRVLQEKIEDLSVKTGIYAVSLYWSTLEERRYSQSAYSKLYLENYRLNRFSELNDLEQALQGAEERQRALLMGTNILDVKAVFMAAQGDPFGHNRMFGLNDEARHLFLADQIEELVAAAKAAFGWYSNGQLQVYVPPAETVPFYERMHAEHVEARLRNATVAGLAQHFATPPPILSSVMWHMASALANVGIALSSAGLVILTYRYGAGGNFFRWLTRDHRKAHRLFLDAIVRVSTVLFSCKHAASVSDGIKLLFTNGIGQAVEFSGIMLFTSMAATTPPTVGAALGLFLSQMAVTVVFKVVGNILVAFLKEIAILKVSEETQRRITAESQMKSSMDTQKKLLKLKQKNERDARLLIGQGNLLDHLSRFVDRRILYYFEHQGTIVKGVVTMFLLIGGNLVSQYGTYALTQTGEYVLGSSLITMADHSHWTLAYLLHRLKDLVTFTSSVVDDHLDADAMHTMVSRMFIQPKIAAILLSRIDTAHWVKLLLKKGRLLPSEQLTAARFLHMQWTWTLLFKTIASQLGLLLGQLGTSLAVMNVLDADSSPYVDMAKSLGQYMIAHSDDIPWRQWLSTSLQTIHELLELSLVYEFIGEAGIMASQLSSAAASYGLDLAYDTGVVAKDAAVAAALHTKFLAERAAFHTKILAERAAVAGASAASTAYQYTTKALSELELREKLLSLLDPQFLHRVFRRAVDAFIGTSRTWLDSLLHWLKVSSQRHYRFIRYNLLGVVRTNVAPAHQQQQQQQTKADAVQLPLPIRIPAIPPAPLGIAGPPQVKMPIPPAVLPEARAQARIPSIPLAPLGIAGPSQINVPVAPQLRIPSIPNAPLGITYEQVIPQPPPTATMPAPAVPEERAQLRIPSIPNAPLGITYEQLIPQPPPAAAIPAPAIPEERAQLRIPSIPNAPLGITYEQVIPQPPPAAAMPAPAIPEERAQLRIPSIPNAPLGITYQQVISQPPPAAAIPAPAVPEERAQLRIPSIPNAPLGITYGQVIPQPPPAAAMPAPAISEEREQLRIPSIPNAPLGITYEQVIPQPPPTATMPEQVITEPVSQEEVARGDAFNGFGDLAALVMHKIQEVKAFLDMNVERVVADVKENPAKYMEMESGKIASASAAAASTVAAVEDAVATEAVDAAVAVVTATEDMELQKMQEEYHAILLNVVQPAEPAGAPIEEEQVQVVDMVEEPISSAGPIFIPSAEQAASLASRAHEAAKKWIWEEQEPMAQSIFMSRSVPSLKEYAEAVAAKVEARANAVQRNAEQSVATLQATPGAGDAITSMIVTKAFDSITSSLQVIRSVVSSVLSSVKEEDSASADTGEQSSTIYNPFDVQPVCLADRTTTTTTTTAATASEQTTSATQQAQTEATAASVDETLAAVHGELVKTENLQEAIIAPAVEERKYYVEQVKRMLVNVGKHLYERQEDPAIISWSAMFKARDYSALALMSTTELKYLLTYLGETLYSTYDAVQKEITVLTLSARDPSLPGDVQGSLKKELDYWQAQLSQVKSNIFEGSVAYIATQLEPEMQRIKVNVERLQERVLDSKTAATFALRESVGPAAALWSSNRERVGKMMYEFLTEPGLVSKDTVNTAVTDKVMSILENIDKRVSADMGLPLALDVKLMKELVELAKAWENQLTLAEKTRELDRASLQISFMNEHVYGTTQDAYHYWRNENNPIRDLVQEANKGITVQLPEVNRGIQWGIEYFTKNKNTMNLQYIFSEKTAKEARDLYNKELSIADALLEKLASTEKKLRVDIQSKFLTETDPTQIFADKQGTLYSVMHTQQEKADMEKEQELVDSIVKSFGPTEWAQAAEIKVTHRLVWLQSILNMGAKEVNGKTLALFDRIAKLGAQVGLSPGKPIEKLKWDIETLKEMTELTEEIVQNVQENHGELSAGVFRKFLLYPFNSNLEIPSIIKMKTDLQETIFTPFKSLLGDWYDSKVPIAFQREQIQNILGNDSSSAFLTAVKSIFTRFGTSSYTIFEHIAKYMKSAPEIMRQLGKVAHFVKTDPVKNSFMADSARSFLIQAKDVIEKAKHSTWIPGDIYKYMHGAAIWDQRQAIDEPNLTVASAPLSSIIASLLLPGQTYIGPLLENVYSVGSSLASVFRQVYLLHSTVFGDMTAAAAAAATEKAKPTAKRIYAPKSPENVDLYAYYRHLLENKVFNLAKKPLDFGKVLMSIPAAAFNFVVSVRRLDKLGDDMAETYLTSLSTGRPEHVDVDLGTNVLARSDGVYGTILRTGLIGYVPERVISQRQLSFGDELRAGTNWLAYTLGMTSDPKIKYGMAWTSIYERVLGSISLSTSVPLSLARFVLGIILPYG